MKLGLQLGYWGAKPIDRFIELAQRAEALGFDIVTTAEAWGSDVIVPLAAIATHTKRIRLGTAIMQISARTPAAAAMAAITLDHLSQGRVCLGIGVSGPQVVEGWYGQPFSRPLERTREWVQIFNAILRRDQPVTFDGKQYQLPYRGPGSTGHGKPLVAITHPFRPHIPLWLGAEGPKNVELACTQFDGWIPAFLPPERFDLFGEQLALARSGFEIAMNVSVSIHDDLRKALLPIKKGLALYIGGMGSKEENFHKRMVERSGYADAAQKIQDLWLAGRQMEAIQAVPDELADSLALVGSREHIRENLARWRRSPVTTLCMSVADNFDDTVRHMEILAQEVL